MFAKRFFYVSAGLLCLALAYHFGAQTATAQSGTLVGSVEWNSGRSAAAVRDRIYYETGGSTAPFAAPLPLPVPGTSPVIAVSAVARSVMLENGDVYDWKSPGGPGNWILAGNMFDGATPVQAESWGRVKTRYR